MAKQRIGEARKTSVRTGNKRHVYHRRETRLLMQAGCCTTDIPHGLVRLSRAIYTYRQGDADPWLGNNQLFFSPDQHSQDFRKHTTPKNVPADWVERSRCSPAKQQSPSPVGGFMVRFLWGGSASSGQGREQGFGRPGSHPRL